MLANKQSRGAFGQGQLEAIIADVLPKGAYEFQFTLSNKSRPDCCIFMPDSGPLIIDAKFPLEAMTALRDAPRPTTSASCGRARQCSRHRKHIADIAGKYLIPGETQDIALMFIPSESVYADLHERFDDVVQQALPRPRHDRVADADGAGDPGHPADPARTPRMREAADQIRDEVGHMMKDVGAARRSRAQAARRISAQANNDIEQILISTGQDREARRARFESARIRATMRTDGAERASRPRCAKLEAGE